MEDRFKITTIRFNFDNPEQLRAWEYLQTMDRDVFKTNSQAISIAIVDYFERYYKLQEDPYLETREREELFVQQIVDAVVESLRQTLPLFLAGCVAGASALQPSFFRPVKPLQQAEPAEADMSAEPASADIDWDFVGE